MFNFVCNLHSSHVHIASAGGDKMAAIFHAALKRFKKRRAQTEVMKDTEHPEINTAP
jgi:hypothetical protein